MLTFRTSNRGRYAKALRHLSNHPERYAVTVYGRDYSADLKNKATGYGWYIQYLKLA